MKNNHKIGIVGLGYVGLPLAVEFGKKYKTAAYDINRDRVSELLNGLDSTGEITKRNLQSSIKLSLSSDINSLKDCNIYIISVPTPINNKNEPDLSILFSATKSIGQLIKKDDIVIYESTVYPGCTEEDCVPLLEKESGMKYNKDFFCGYSPERINPGDKKRTVTKIVKVTSGSNYRIAKIVDDLYSSIITSGTFLASSIKVAEAAKIIENCQRDINIAFVNELSILFDKMDLDTQEVLDAAGTKWNFLPFRPGLVGGHCIGVDPYYLTYKAKQLGYDSKIILSGRKLNDNYVKYINENINNHFVKITNKKKLNALLMGVTFKENCPDIRNSKVFDLHKLLNKKFNIDVYDPYASKDEVLKKYNIKLLDFNLIKPSGYDCIIISVAHTEFLNINIEKFLFSKKSLVYDMKGIYNNKKYMRL
ncbi:MAG: Vi polysaccharide biosynthesis protein VipA/TviB [Candidatus Marinimicrobia bacterium]|nr:Vi polysaccharide biosynthesis protein VipA/TviB [Candidatus Neomarinimicrobiota bacterium]